MVKICCDRCGKQIENRYYTISFNSYDTDPKDDWCTTTACSATGYSGSRDGMLKMLNSQRMYCSQCRSEILKFINNEYNDAFNEIVDNLAQSGIFLKDENGKYRSMIDVLNDIAEKWNDLKT